MEGKKRQREERAEMEKKHQVSRQSVVLESSSCRSDVNASPHPPKKVEGKE